MRSHQPTLFEMPTKPRAKRRVLMHVIDAGPCDCDPDDTTPGGIKDLVVLKCEKCGHETDWQRVLRSEAKRGLPCPECNT